MISYPPCSWVIWDVMLQKGSNHINELNKSVVETFKTCFIFVSIVRKSWHSCVACDKLCCMQLSYLRCNARGRFDTSQLIEQIGFRHFWNMFHIRFDRIHFIGYELYAWRICTYAYAHACMHAYMHEVNWPWPLRNKWENHYHFTSLRTSP